MRQHKYWYTVVRAGVLEPIQAGWCFGFTDSMAELDARGIVGDVEGLRISHSHECCDPITLRRLKLDRLSARI